MDYYKYVVVSENDPDNPNNFYTDYLEEAIEVASQEASNTNRILLVCEIVGVAEGKVEKTKYPNNYKEVR